ncbi:MAG: hypothetical protein Terrestrivirus4_95 [Terrestrivirus sp.]|uniref:Uncharacterized protein n=1 Tax=Terrestrivirus sp. TaxID=2487775 RepID=A0A3G4ZMH4_9VIRU|nr:MAG: hypothetical protein Terrestrivirus4_95 [Terrestrivirus sp.]
MPSAKVPKTQSAKKETTSGVAPVTASTSTAPTPTPVAVAPTPVADVVVVPATTQKSKPKQKKTLEPVVVAPAVVPGVAVPAPVPVVAAPAPVAAPVAAPAEPAEKAPKVQKPKVVRAKKEKEPVQVALSSSEQSAPEPAVLAPEAVQENEQEAGVLVDADLRGGQRPKKRYFACVYENEQFGRVWGVKPKQAANKGFTSILKHMNKSGINYTDGEEINFAIAETTRGSKQGEYLYLGKRVLLEIPIQVTKKIKDKVTKEVIATKQVPYKYKNIVHKVPKVGRVNA